MTYQQIKVECPCKKLYSIHVFGKDSFTGCGNPDGFRLACQCSTDHRVSALHQKKLEVLNDEVHQYLIEKRIYDLLLEKTQILFDHGIWPWNRKSRQLHQEINLKLEALGVYQGKYRK
tara:strand:- start:457 stop:810 length:354 start_codon:yes stop_codon:yes gene_type:complete